MACRFCGRDDPLPLFPALLLLRPEQPLQTTVKHMRQTNDRRMTGSDLESFITHFGLCNQLGEAGGC